MRVVAATLGFALAAILATGPSVSRAELLAFLDGDARPVPATTLFAAPGASAASFWLFSGHADRDFRSEPGTLVLFTQSGLLVAEAGAGARRFGPWRFDTASGRPLRRDASPDANCPTGQDPACWHPGDPVPYSSEVAAALGSALGSPAPSIPTPQTPTQEMFAMICATSIGFSDLDRGACGSSIPIPLVPLNTDPPAIRKTSPWQLSDEEQALLGCGPFWGTDCATDGIDFTKADASVLMPSGGVVESPPVSAMPSGERAPFPCTPESVGYCRTENSPSNTLFPPYRLLPPYGGNAFVNEMAALSFNFQNLLVAFSAPAAPKGDPSGSSNYDPTDPFSRAPRQCSFVQPQYCASVLAFQSFATTAQALDDDPGGPGLHWIWEAGAEYRVIEASGEFAGYAGGRVHVLGVEHARTRHASLGIPIALFPAPGTALNPEAAFAMPAAGAATGAPLGLAYLTAPEPSGAALAVVATAALTLLARRPSRPA